MTGHSVEWLAGATAEARARTEGRSAGGLEVREFVDVLARQGRDRDAVCATVAVVFSAGWPWRRRAHLAWRLVRGRLS